MGKRYGNAASQCASSRHCRGRESDLRFRPVRAEGPARLAPRPLAEWVKKSNQNAKIMVELMAKLQPEAASQFGVEGYDDQISDMSPGFVERQIKAIRVVHTELVRRLAAESDRRVKQDLEILVKAAADSIKETELSEIGSGSVFQPGRMLMLPVISRSAGRPGVGRAGIRPR